LVNNSSIAAPTERRGSACASVSVAANLLMRKISMTKEKAKKEPQKTLKEKRREKKEKKNGKGVSNL
jgi:hypothetical protein